MPVHGSGTGGAHLAMTARVKIQEFTWKSKDIEVPNENLNVASSHVVFQANMLRCTDFNTIDRTNRYENTRGNYSNDAVP